MKTELQPIILDVLDIKAKLSMDKKYSDKDLTILEWDSGEGFKEYLVDVKKDKTEFMGILNRGFKRDNFGKWLYSNGEKYFGIFQNELRNRQGFYIYNKEEDKLTKEIIYPFYFGFWKDNLKDGRGNYLWLHEKGNEKGLFSDFDNSNFDCFSGSLKEDKFVKGVYFTKRKDNYYLYYGKFDENNKKCGENCFYYNSTKDQVLFGKMENDRFINGYISKFNEDGVLIDILYCEYDDKGEIIHFKEACDLDEKNLKTKRETIQNFRSIIVEQDDFGTLYETFHGMNIFINEKLNDLEIFNSQTEFPKLMDMSYTFNKIDLYNRLEKYFNHLS